MLKLIEYLSNNNLKVISLCLAWNKLKDKLFSEIAIAILKNICNISLNIGPQSMLASQFFQKISLKGT